MSNEPMDPQAAAFVRGAVTRRSVLAGAGGVGIAAALAACGTGGTATPTAAPTAAAGKDLSATEKKLRWQNWPYYLDKEGGKGSTLQTFEKQTGIDVNYTYEIEDNIDFTKTVRPQLERQQPTGYDIVVLTDWMADRWIRSGWALPLNYDNIPNGDNLRAQLKDIEFDVGRKYSLPWQSGFAGLGYNGSLLKKLTGKSEIKTLDELWDPKLKGRITVLSEMRDTIGLILLSQGKNPADFADSDFDAALAELQKHVDSGQIRKVAGNDYVTALDNGEIAAAIAWSGDLFGSEKNTWLQPESGATYWTDNMMIPALASHKTNAEKAMNFYYDPANQGAMIVGGVTYVTPVPGAQPIVAKSDKALSTNPLIFPTDDFLATTKIFKVLTPEDNDRYQAAFDDVTGA